MHPFSLTTSAMVSVQAEYLSLGRDTNRRLVSRSHPKTICCSAGDPSARSFNIERMAHLKILLVCSCLNVASLFASTGSAGNSCLIVASLSVIISSLPAKAAVFSISFSLASESYDLWLLEMFQHWEKGCWLGQSICLQEP